MSILFKVGYVVKSHSFLIFSLTKKFQKIYGTKERIRKLLNLIKYYLSLIFLKQNSPKNYPLYEFSRKTEIIQIQKV